MEDQTTRSSALCFSTELNKKDLRSQFATFRLWATRNSKTGSGKPRLIKALADSRDWQVAPRRSSVSLGAPNKCSREGSTRKPPAAPLRSEETSEFVWAFLPFASAPVVIESLKMPFSHRFPLPKGENNRWFHSGTAATRSFFPPHIQLVHRFKKAAQQASENYGEHREQTYEGLLGSSVPQRTVENLLASLFGGSPCKSCGFRMYH